MKQTDRTNNHVFFRLLLFALVMLLPIGAWGQAQIQYYPIEVGGVTVTSENCMGITGDNIDGMVKYDDLTSTLTLEGASISSDGIFFQANGNLNLVISGTCTVRGNISTTGSSTLTLKFDDTDISGTLTYVPSNYEDPTGFTNVVYDGMYLAQDYLNVSQNLVSQRNVKYSPTRQRFEESQWQTVSTIYFSNEKNYELWLGGTKVSEDNRNNIFDSENSEGIATASFNPDNNTLTLTDLTMEGNSIYNSGIISRLDNLIISLNGTNTIYCNDTCTAIRADKEGEQTLTIVKGSDNSSLALSATQAIHDFKTLTLTDLAWNKNYIYRYDETMSTSADRYRLMEDDNVEAGKNYATGTMPTLFDSSMEIYNLWVAGTQVTSANAADIFVGTENEGKVSFTLAGADNGNTLTLKGAELAGNIISGLGDLTINIQNTNTIAVADTASVIRSINGGKLTITKTGDNPTLVLSNTRQSNYHAPSIKDFASFELSEGLYLSNTRGYNNSDYMTPAVYDSYINNYGGETTMGLINPTDMDKGSKGIRNVTISTDVNYPIWIAHHKETVGAGYNIIYAQINTTNKDDIFEDDIPKVSFIPGSVDNGNINTLHLNGAAILSAIVTSLPNLTIEFSGENSLDKDGRVDGFIHGVANSVLTFKAIADESEIQLYSANDYAVVEGFGDVQFIDAVAQYDGNFSYNKTTRRFENQYGAMTLLAIVDDITTYGITVTKGTNTYGITSTNRLNVLNNAATAASVQFDGDHTLILNNAELSSIQIDDAQNIFSTSGLTIYLKGDNTINNGGESIINNGNSSINLTFATGDGTTTELKQGTLTCSYTDPGGGGRAANSLFDNIDIIYANRLSANLDTTDPLLLTATISTKMEPIVMIAGEVQINDGNGQGLGEDIELPGKTDEEKTELLAAGYQVNDVLYTLPDEDDGYMLEDGKKLVALNSYMTDEDVNTIVANINNGINLPGTKEFAEGVPTAEPPVPAFHGLTFLLPAGNGDIVFEVNTNESGILHVKVGNNDPVEITETDGFKTVTIPYSLTKESYVLIYSVVPPMADPARLLDSHRAPGRKTGTTTQIKKLGVSARSVGSTPPPPLSPKTLTKADIDELIASADDLKDGLTINDADYKDIADDAFDDLDGTQATFIDLSQTSIIDQTVDRNAAPYNKVPNGAFVYLPTGNDVSAASDAIINNVVIGTVCPDMLLSESHPFKAAIDFTAEKAKLDRDFTKDQNSSIYLPFAISKETASVLGTFYEFTDVTDGKIIMTPLEDGTEANTPYMFKAAKESLNFEMVDVKSVLAESPFIGGVIFEGTYQQINILSTSELQYYCFTASDGKFVHVVDQHVTVKPFRAYMMKSGSALSNYFDIDWGDDTTDLNDVRSKMLEVRGDVFFDLQGRRVMKPTKGIYIHNGKKIVIK